MTARDAARSVFNSPDKLAIGSALCMLLVLFVPAIRVSGTVMGMPTGAVFLTGVQLASWAAWATFILFSLAAASRFVPSLAPYRKLLDLAAFAMAALALLYAAFGGPVVSAIQQVDQVQNELGGLFGGGLHGAARMPVAPVASFSVMPHIGAVLFLVAPVLLLLAKRRERASA